MNQPRVLFAHERPVVRGVVERVLAGVGLSVHGVGDGSVAKELLETDRWDALVCDVATPGVPGYDLVGIAKRGRDVGARVVILVASVYRRTAYKRRPSRLYGADDYVELHHLGDQLPQKLVQLLGLPPPGTADDADQVMQVLEDEGDTRFATADARRLASLIVTDMVLYNGERVMAATSLKQAEGALKEDLDVARHLLEHVYRAEGLEQPAGDPVGDAFRELISAILAPSDG